MLPASPEPDLLWAVAVAVIYFGSLVATGILLRMACRWLMERYGADLGDVHAQAGPNRGSRKVFLLGSWRSED